jgi:hypothetical protein
VDEEDGYALVADATANTVWKIAPNDEATDPEEYLEVSVFVTYPTVEEAEGEQGPPEFVPTSLATDDAGHVFVGGLGSEVPGAASIVEYEADGTRSVAGRASRESSASAWTTTPSTPRRSSARPLQVLPATRRRRGAARASQRAGLGGQGQPLDDGRPALRGGRPVPGWTRDRRRRLHVRLGVLDVARQRRPRRVRPDSTDLEGGQVWSSTSRAPVSSSR